MSPASSSRFRRSNVDGSFRSTSRAARQGQGAPSLAELARFTHIDVQCSYDPGERLEGPIIRALRAPAWHARARSRGAELTAEFGPTDRVAGSLGSVSELLMAYEARRHAVTPKIRGPRRGSIEDLSR